MACEWSSSLRTLEFVDSLSTNSFNQVINFSGFVLTAIDVAEDVCFPVAHRQVVLTIPKRLRVHARFDRKLLGKLSPRSMLAAPFPIRRETEHRRE